MTFWLYKFRKLDVKRQAHRQMLIDTFVNAIFLYDDKLVLTYNFKEGTETITLETLHKDCPKSKKKSSDMDCIGAQQPDSKESGFFRASGQTGSLRTVSTLGGCRGMRALLPARTLPEGVSVAHEVVGITHNVNAAVAVAGQVAHHNEKCGDDQCNDCFSFLNLV